MANEIEKYQFNKLMNKINYVLENLEYYINSMGGAKRITVAGTYTFKIPVGVTSLLVSGIGAGGGGGAGAWSGKTSNDKRGGGGGGGGGRAEYVIDQQINVTPGEVLTIIVGEPGTGGQASSSWAEKGEDGGNGGATIFKRGETVLLSITGGFGGVAASAGVGGTGGEIDGATGGDQRGQSTTDTRTYLGGAAGIGGSVGFFGTFGNGGAGGYGAYGRALVTGWETNTGRGGYDGESGAVLICFGEGVNYYSVGW